MKRINTRSIVLIGTFSAISIIIARFLVIYLTNSLRISFGNVPIILAGLLLGPWAGALTGAISDILGAAVFSPLGWYPPLTISPVLVGIIPGLLKPLLLRTVTYPRMLAILFATNLITSIGVTTYLLSGLYGTPYRELLVLRAPLSLAMTLVEALILFLLYKRLKKELPSKN